VFLKLVDFGSGALSVKCIIRARSRAAGSLPELLGLFLQKSPTTIRFYCGRDIANEGHGLTVGTHSQ